MSGYRVECRRCSARCWISSGEEPFERGDAWDEWWDDWCRAVSDFLRACDDCDGPERDLQDNDMATE